MKLLLDENLSPRLAAAIQDLYPGSSHVETCGLEATNDIEVWMYAHRHGYAIVTKDADFYQLSVLRGAPPKVIWLQIGNSTTAEIEDVLRRFAARITAFEESAEETCLAITRKHARPA